MVATMVTGGRKLPNATDKLIADYASDCITYNGRAADQDTLTSQPLWQISRTLYSGSLAITQFANNADFTSVWDDRATYFSAESCTPPYPYPLTQISDGTNSLVINPDGSINIGGSISIQSVVTETIANMTLTLAGTEYPYTLPIGTKAYRFKLRSGQYFRYATTAGATATVYSTEQVVEKEGVSGGATRTLYFQATNASEVMEISYWI